jgi:hypothetical protein
MESNYNDDPVNDLDPYVFAGVDNIYYPGAEDGLTVFVENQDDDGPVNPPATLYINVHDNPTEVFQIPELHPFEVFTAARVDGMSGELERVEEFYDCGPEWGDYGCAADLP